MDCSGYLNVSTKYVSNWVLTRPKAIVVALGLL